MKEKTIRSIFSIIIIVFVSISCVSMISGKVTLKLKNMGVISNEDNVKRVNVDWKKLYPFQEIDGTESTTVQNDQSKITKLVKFISKLPEVAEDQVNKSKPYMIFFQELLQLSSSIDAITGKPYVFRENLTLLKNGYIYGTSEKIDQTENANNIIEFKDWLDSKNIPFLYVQHPIKLSKYDNQLAEVDVDYGNDNLDELLNILQDNGIKTMDLRELMHNQQINWYNYFYKTDHHWTPEAGIWAANEVAKELNKEYGYDLDLKYTDINNYTSQTYEKWLFGAQGKKTSGFYTSPEDFTIYFPNFETNMTVIHKSLNYNKTGSFKDTVFEWEKIENREYVYYDRYGAYLHGNCPLTQIINNNSKNNLKVLFIENSFSLVMTPYFSQTVSQVDMLDVRPDVGNFTGSVKTYINQTNPDIVILFYDSEDYEYK